jgi:4-amino-4-deoxy-L-arabinose transferase-like glycosyltransferase
MVAVNIGHRSVTELAMPLDFAQLAPVPWLWLEKLLVSIGGMHELVMRFPALVAGIILPPLVWLAGRRLVGDPAALVATVLTTTSANLIFYSNELKPYEFDAAIAAGLLLMAAHTLFTPDKGRGWRWLGLVGLVATLFSFTAVLMLAAIGVASLWQAIGLGDRSAIRRTLTWSVSWVAAFAIPQFILYHDAAEQAGMSNYWGPALAQFDVPGVLGRASAGANEIVATLLTVSVWPGVVLFMLIFGVGIWGIWRRHGWVSVMLVVLPLVFAVLAWGLDQLPLQRRVVLFLAPVVAMLAGAGVVTIIDWMPSAAQTASKVLASVMIVVVATAGLRVALHTPKTSGGRELASEILSGVAAPVWFTASSAPVWLYYSTDWSAPDSARIAWFVSAARELQPRTLPDSLFARRDSTRGWELMARRSGLVPNIRGTGNLVVDEWWAPREARQISAVSGGGAWLLMTHDRSGEKLPLLATFEQAGFVLDTVAHERRGTLWWLKSTKGSPPTNTGANVNPQ